LPKLSVKAREKVAKKAKAARIAAEAEASAARKTFNGRPPKKKAKKKKVPKLTPEVSIGPQD
jgi:hypothetical protein